MTTYELTSNRLTQGVVRQYLGVFIDVNQTFRMTTAEIDAALARTGRINVRWTDIIDYFNGLDRNLIRIVNGGGSGYRYGPYRPIAKALP